MTHAPIVLLAINARYSHASLGARSLLRAMDADLFTRTQFVEAHINQSLQDIVQAILPLQPVLIGIGVYIWNRTCIEQLVPRIQRARPDCTMILGGPEISYDLQSPLAQTVDCVVQGEGETLWPRLCRNVLRGESLPRRPAPDPPDLAAVPIPVDLYSAKDIATRNLYLETARGCPFTCRFCLSSLDPSVRRFPLPAVRHALDHLLTQGARDIRLVDRSFNMNGDHALHILDALLAHPLQLRRIHLEMVPEYLSHAMRERLRQFQPGQLHIETGIQSFQSHVLARMRRPTRSAAVAEGIHWLVHEAKADVHADLIAGLPGETMDQFCAGFDRLYQLQPTEIQLGILKHLPGTDLHLEPGMHFSLAPPYAVQQSDAMSPQNLATVKRFAAHWERVVNRKHFPTATAALLAQGSPWQQFDRFSQELAQQHGLYGFGIVEMAAVLLPALVQHAGLAPQQARTLLRNDYLAGNRRIHVPAFLRAETKTGFLSRMQGS